MYRRLYIHIDLHLTRRWRDARLLARGRQGVEPLAFPVGEG